MPALGRLSGAKNQAKAALGTESLEAFADRGYFKGEEILACEEAGITVMLPKPQTSEAKSEGRFGKQDFRYVAEEGIYICPAGEKLAYRFTNDPLRARPPRARLAPAAAQRRHQPPRAPR
jgi:hypothetical protein